MSDWKVGDSLQTRIDTYSSPSEVVLITCLLGDCWMVLPASFFVFGGIKDGGKRGGFSSFLNAIYT